MWSQVGLRMHHYEQSKWSWWNCSWALSNPKRLCCESIALNMPANLENSTVFTGLERSVFIPISKNYLCIEGTQSCPTLCDPMDCIYNPPGSSIHGILQARILEWGCHVLFQGIFLAQGSNPGLPHYGQTIYPLSHQGIPKKGNGKECSKYRIIALISHTSK